MIAFYVELMKSRIYCFSLRGERRSVFSGFSLFLSFFVLTFILEVILILCIHTCIFPYYTIFLSVEPYSPLSIPYSEVLSFALMETCSYEGLHHLNLRRKRCCFRPLYPTVSFERTSIKLLHLLCLDLFLSVFVRCDRL